MIVSNTASLSLKYTGSVLYIQQHRTMSVPCHQVISILETTVLILGILFHGKIGPGVTDLFTSRLSDLRPQGLQKLVGSYAYAHPE